MVNESNSSIPLTSITAFCLESLLIDYVNYVTDQNSAEGYNICRQNFCQKKTTERKTLQVFRLEFKVIKPADLATYIV